MTEFLVRTTINFLLVQFLIGPMLGMSVDPQNNLIICALLTFLNGISFVYVSHIDE